MRTLTILALTILLASAASATTWTVVQSGQTGVVGVNGYCPRQLDVCTWGVAQGLATIGTGHAFAIALQDNFDGPQPQRTLVSVQDCTDAQLDGSGNCVGSLNTWTLFGVAGQGYASGSTNTMSVDGAYVTNSVPLGTHITITRSGHSSLNLERWGGAWAECSLSGGTIGKDDIEHSNQSTPNSATHTMTTTTPTGNDCIMQFTVGPAGPTTVTSPYSTFFGSSGHFNFGIAANIVSGAAPTWTATASSSQTGNVIAFNDGSTPTTFPLAVTVTGSGTVTSSPAGISCPGTCTASFTSGASVTLTESPTPPSTFSGWGLDCAGSGTATTCPLTLSASRSATATFLAPSALPALPVFTDNNELTCGFTGQCPVGSPALTTPYIFSPIYEYQQGASGWVGGLAPPSCSFSLPYAPTFAGACAAFNAMEACRSQHAPGVLILDTVVGQLTSSSSCIIQQTNTTVTHATSPLIMRTAAWANLEALPEPIGSGGIQQNVPESTQIGLRNPSLDGQNLISLSVECPAQSAGAGGLAYQLGETTICIPAGSFTLANGQLANTASYNYLRYMTQFIATGTSAPFIFCTVGTGASGAQTCNNPSTLPHFASDLMYFEGLVFSEAPGNSANMNLVNINDNSGVTTSVAQWPSHIHFRRVAFLGDWATLSTGYNQIASGMSMSSCDYCSVIGSHASQLLRPSGEGHIMGASGTRIKISNNWFEGQSSCVFGGGSSTAPTITPIGSFVSPQDVEFRRTRCTFPLSWLGSPFGASGGNIPNANVYWGGAGDNPAQPTLVNVDVTGLILTYVSGPQFHDSTSFWPGNNVFVNGTGNSNKYTLVNAGSWTQVCPTFCFPANPPTTLTLTTPVTGAPLTNVGFILNGAGIVRKNCDEKKSGVRYLKSGVIFENTDASGGQSGICEAFSNRNTSGGGQGTNYQNTLTDFNVQNVVDQNTCNALSMDARSASSAGNGGGVTTPMQRMSFYNIAHLNITATNPGCAAVVSTGIQVNAGSQSWTGTVTENGAGNSATFVAISSVDVGAPLVSDTATFNGYANPSLTINVTNANVDFVNGEFVHFPCAGCAGDSGNAFLENGDYAITSLTSSTLVLNVGNGFTGSLAGGTKVQGPAGFQYLGIPTGFPVFLSGAGCGAFSSPTNAIGPLASTGASAWNGSYVVQAVGYGTTGTASVTFPWTATASSSATCTLSNIQGAPASLYIQKNLVVTDAADPFGSGSSPANGAPYALGWVIQDDLFLNSGASVGHAGWFSPATGLGEGTITEAFQANAGTLTASNLLIPRPFGAANQYTEYCNNSVGSLLNCTGGSPPAHMYFPCSTGDPCTSGGVYASCQIGFVNACSGNIPLVLPDPHAYALAPTSAYFTAASDGSPLDVDFTAIDAAQVANTYSPQVMGVPVSVSIGPFPDSLMGTPGPPSPTAPAAKAFASIEWLMWPEANGWHGWSNDDQESFQFDVKVNGGTQ